MNKAFIKEVGFGPWCVRTVQRQIFKRIFHRDHRMVLPSGEFFSLPVGSSFATEVFTTNGDVDWGSEALLFQLLKGDGVFLDVGANIGYYAVYMSKKVKAAYCFEPDPRTFRVLQKNCAHLQNLYMVPKAVGKETGKISFTLENKGEVSHISTSGDANKNRVEVGITTVDSFVTENELSVEAIKIDVEGFDLDVIKGAVQTLRRQRPVVLTESEPVAELFALAGKVDYKVYAFLRERESRRKKFTEVQNFVPAGYSSKMFFLVPEERENEFVQAAQTQTKPFN